MRDILKNVVLLFVFSVINSSLFGQYLLPYEDEWNAGTYGYIDRTGKIIIPAQFQLDNDDRAEPFYEGMRQQPYTSGQKQTIFFRTDGTKVTYNFEYMSGFSSGISLASSSRSIMFVNLAGQSYPANYKYIFTDSDGHCFNEGIALVLDENDKTIVIDTSFRKLFELPVSFTNTSHKFSNGLLAIKNARGLWGYIDKTGKIVIPAKFALLSRYFGNGQYYNDRENENANFQGNYAILSNEYNKFYVINKQGEIIKNFETIHYDYPFSRMFIHGDYLVYALNDYGIIRIINLLNEKEIDVDTSEVDKYGDRVPVYASPSPKVLGENIYYNGRIISYNGEILFKKPNYVSNSNGRNISIWYDKYIVIYNDGYFTIYDETGVEILVH
jgi:hypothetical protein